MAVCKAEASGDGWFGCQGCVLAVVGEVAEGACL